MSKTTPNKFITILQQVGQLLKDETAEERAQLKVSVRDALGQVEERVIEGAKRLNLSIGNFFPGALAKSAKSGDNEHIKGEGVNQMTQEGMSNIKGKLLELAELIKQGTAEETKELKEDVLENLNEMKARLDKVTDKIGQGLGGNLDEFLGDLEGKALKVQYTIQEKASQGLAQKDQVVSKAADSLIETITKMKNALVSKDEEK